jgi:hypothetical protein
MPRPHAGAAGEMSGGSESKIGGDGRRMATIMICRASEQVFIVFQYHFGGSGFR